MATTINKENAALQQAKLTSFTNNKKRSLTLANGDELDVRNANLPVSREVVEALRLRVIELESVAAPPPAKKARTSAASSADAGPSTASASKPVDEKKTNAMMKKIFDRLVKEVKTDAYKFKGGNAKTVKFDEVFQEDEFQALFQNGAGGHLIQPTPDNKPNSTVTIIRYLGETSVKNLFGKNFKEFKGQQWAHTYGFEKSYKIGMTPLTINELHINYSKNGMKCALKFEVQERNPQCIRGYGWF